jgi:hypothetical protein
MVSRPGQRGAPEEPMEKPDIKGLKDFIEVVVMTCGCRKTLSAASLTNILGLAGDRFGGYVSAVAVGMGWSDWFLVELGEQNMSDRVMNGIRCGLKKI